MGSSSHSKRKHKIEPITLDEVFDSPSLKGLLSFLNVPPRDAVESTAFTGPSPPADALVSQSPVPIGAPELGAPVSGAPVLDSAGLNVAPDAGALPISSNRGAPDLGAPVLPAMDESGGDPVTFVASAKTGAPILGAPVLGARKLGAPTSDTADLYANAELSGPGASTLGAPDLPADLPSDLHDASVRTSALNTGAPVLGAPAFDSISDYIYTRPVKIREARTVQDGHTQGEQLVYETLWRLGKPHAGDSRLVVIGLRTLAPLVPISYNNCQANVRSLIQKLAVEEVAAGHRNYGRGYMVYSYRDILQRRKASGLTHVIRSTRGARLISPGAPDLGAPAFRSGVPKPGAPPLNSGAPNSVNPGAPDLPSRNKEATQTGRLPSSEKPWPLATSALIETMGHADDDAVRRMADDSLRNAPDATDDELAQFIREEAPRVIRNRKLDNPMGMLIRQVPRRFVGEAFQMFRDAQRRAKDAQIAQSRAWARQILEDPEATGEDRAWAQSIIGET